MTAIGAIGARKALFVRTRCTTVDEFVETFRVFCDGATLFVPTSMERATGIEMPFSFQLADGTPVLSGVGVVLDALATNRNAFHRPGLRLKLSRVTDESVAIHARLQPAPRVELVPANKPKTRAASPRLTPSDGTPHLSIEDLVLFDKTAPISIFGQDGSRPLADVSFPAPSSTPEVAAPEPEPESKPAPPAPRPEEPMVLGLPRSKLIAMGAICTIGGAAIALAIVTITGRSEPAEAATRIASPPKPVAKRVTPAPAPAPAPAIVAAPAATPETSAAAAAAVPVPRGPATAARCTLSIAASPADAEIRIDGRLLGTSPAFFVGDCATAVVEVSRKRYETTTQTVTFEDGEPQTLTVRLKRPAKPRVSAETGPSS